jgi:competence protein ComEA
MCTTGGDTAAHRPSPTAGEPAPAPVASGSRVNINTASASELDTLPGIGASKAAAIIADRDQQGPYASCADLQRVTGIGAKTVANLEHLCIAN